MNDPLDAPDSFVAPPRSQQARPDTQAALVALNFRVSFKLRQRMKLEATARGITMTTLLIAALESYLGE
jgi:hypothetical protein